MSDSFFRGRIFDFEIQHIIPSEVWSSDSIATRNPEIELHNI